MARNFSSLFPFRTSSERYFTRIDEKYQDNEVVTREPPGDKAYSEIPWHITGRRTGTPRYAFMLSNCR